MVNSVGERHSLAVYEQSARVYVEYQRAVFDDAAVGCRIHVAVPAQHRAHARHHLAQREGTAYEIVGTEVEALDDIVLAVARGAEYQRHTGCQTVFLETFQQVIAVNLAGQVDLRYYQVIFVDRQHQRVFRRRNHLHVIPFGTQIVKKHGINGRIVGN